MANRERGEVSVSVGGQDYVLVLTTNAMCEIEDLLSTPGKEVSFLDALQQVNRRQARAVRAFVCAAMREHLPKYTLKDAGALIQERGGIIAFLDDLRRLIDSAQPDKEDEAIPDEGRPQTAQVGIGGRSTSKLAASA